MSFDICRIPSDIIKKLREQYRSALFDDIVPWWMQHSPDNEYGGYYNCLERDGKPYAGDKFMWMTGRQIWMFSHLYNQHEARSEWRDFAQHGTDFLIKNAFTDNGKMYFRLTRKGEPLAQCLSLFTEGLAAIEYGQRG